jgi:hypothetical protein
MIAAATASGLAGVIRSVSFRFLRDDPQPLQLPAHRQRVVGQLVDPALPRGQSLACAVRIQDAFVHEAAV